MQLKDISPKLVNVIFGDTVAGVNESGVRAQLKKASQNGTNWGQSEWPRLPLPT